MPQRGTRRRGMAARSSVRVAVAYIARVRVAIMQQVVVHGRVWLHADDVAGVLGCLRQHTRGGAVARAGLKDTKKIFTGK